MGFLLIITGSMGAGKTSVLGEASDLLVRRQIAHAAIDVDALGLAYLPAATRSDDAMYSNLRSVWHCFRGALGGVPSYRKHPYDGAARRDARNGHIAR